MDIIFLRELKVETLIGVYPWEKRVPQNLRLDLEIALPNSHACHSDDIADAIDYAEIVRHIQSTLRSRHFNLLEGGFDQLPFFYSDQYDLGLEYSGHASPTDELVVRGDLDSGEFIAFWLDGATDVVRAGMNVNVWDVQDDIQELISSKVAVDRAKLADPDVPLTSAKA